eukprot:1028684-Pleurochrysis_carterae.AAC.1
MAASVAPPMLMMRSDALSERARMRDGSVSGIQSPERKTRRSEHGSRSRACSAYDTSSSMKAGT